MFIGVMILLKLFSEVCGEFAHEQSRNIFMTGKVFQSFLYYSASSGVVSRRSQFFCKNANIRAESELQFLRAEWS